MNTSRLFRSISTHQKRLRTLAAGSFTIVTGSGDQTTNYTDSGGATNVPSRYYRIRLVP